MRNLQKETEATILAWIRTHGGTSLCERMSDEGRAYEEREAM